MKREVMRAVGTPLAAHCAWGPRLTAQLITAPCVPEDTVGLGHFLLQTPVCLAVAWGEFPQPWVHPSTDSPLPWFRGTPVSPGPAFRELLGEAGLGGPQGACSPVQGRAGLWELA